jgi:hypothetical protein
MSAAAGCGSVDHAVVIVNEVVHPDLGVLAEQADRHQQSDARQIGRPTPS